VQSQLFEQVFNSFCQIVLGTICFIPHSLSFASLFEVTYAQKHTYVLLSHLRWIYVKSTDHFSTSGNALALELLASASL